MTNNLTNEEQEILKKEITKAKKREWRNKNYAPIKERNRKLKNTRIHLAKKYYSKGYTQKEVADILNCSVRTIQRYLKANED